MSLCRNGWTAVVERTGDTRHQFVEAADQLMRSSVRNIREVGVASSCAEPYRRSVVVSALWRPPGAVDDDASSTSRPEMNTSESVHLVVASRSAGCMVEGTGRFLDAFQACGFFALSRKRLVEAWFAEASKAACRSPGCTRPEFSHDHWQSERVPCWRKFALCRARRTQGIVATVSQSPEPCSADAGALQSRAMLAVRVAEAAG